MNHSAWRSTLAFTALLSLTALATAQTTRPATTGLSATIPSDYGHYRLRFFTQYHDEALNLCVVCSNSHLIAKTKGKVPVVIFMCGIGERGDDGDGAFFCGPSGWMQRTPVLDESCPVLLVSPQCPPNHTWYEPEMTEVMVHFLAELVKDPRIDTDRVYLTGLSMGGGGTWSVAAAGTKYLAAACPLCPPLTSPETVVPAVKNLPVWLVIGTNDGFLAGCRTMMDGLRKEHADILYTEIPGADHCIWPNIYPKLEFYDWFLTHVRGKPVTRTYTAAELLKIAGDPPPDPLVQKVERDFAAFAPYWQISNWNRDNAPGLHEKLHGRQNVFSAPPLNADTACRMQTTWKIPAGKHGQLHIVAGRALNQDWQLVATVADKQALSIGVNATTAPDGWLDKTVDLAAWTGKEVHLDVYAKSGAAPGHAYFAKLAVELN